MLAFPSEGAHAELTQELPPVRTSADAQHAVEAVRAKIGAQAWTQLLNHLGDVNHNIQTKGIHFWPKKREYLLTGYDYGQFYDWDTYFESLYAAYNGVDTFCYNNADAFLSQQKSDGFVPRGFGSFPWGSQQHFKPFLAQIVLLAEWQKQDIPWLSRHYDPLRKYLEKWASYDTDGNGLVYYPGGCDQAGMDNQYSRCVGKSEGVDLNCYLVREYQAMAILAQVLDKGSEATEWLAKADGMRKRINDVLWDATDGLYYDRDEDTGRLTKTKSVSCFTPLWTGVASQEQAKIMVERHLTNPHEFWSKFPVSSYARTEKDYFLVPGQKCNWRGDTWIPINYMIFHGLIRYGFKDLAGELAYRTLKMALSNPATCEFYNAKTGKGYGRNPFWGWSSLAYVMPLEYEMGLDPTDLKTEQSIPHLIDVLGLTPFTVPAKNMDLPDDIETSDGDEHVSGCVSDHSGSYFLSRNDPSIPYQITFTWNEPRSFSSVSLFSSYCQGQAPTAWDVEVSDDGLSGWTPVASVKDALWMKDDKTIENHSVDFPAVSGKKGLRLTIKAANLRWHHFQITDVDIK